MSFPLRFSLRCDILRRRLQSIRQSRARFMRSMFRRLVVESLEDRRLMARQVSGFLQSPDTWEGTIHVTGDVTVTSQLTIQPGTVVKVDQGKQILIRSEGQLAASGAANAPIIFTSTQDDSVGEDLTGAAVGQPLRGHWQQLILQPNNVLLEHFEVRYAGNVVSPGNTYNPYRVPSLLVTGASVLRNGLVR
ncbi:MAG: hypothetical protein MUF23_12735, partial [Pirellula sp.]|nr:hypothetical protein [Pirellula sp.]